MFSTGVVHSFTGSVEEALTIVNDLGLFIGFNGCSLKTEENLKVIEAIPADKIMIGTGNFKEERKRKKIKNKTK